MHHIISELCRSRNRGPGIYNNLEDIKLNSVNDGTYRGEAEIGPVKVILNVTVKNHIITNIEILRHRTMLGKKAESITEDIIKSQSLLVDVVSGATGSSICIIKAVDNAFDPAGNR